MAFTSVVVLLASLAALYCAEDDCPIGAKDELALPVLKLAEEKVLYLMNSTNPQSVNCSYLKVNKTGDETETVTLIVGNGEGLGESNVNVSADGNQIRIKNGDEDSDGGLALIVRYTDNVTCTVVVAPDEEEISLYATGPLTNSSDCCLMNFQRESTGNATYPKFFDTCVNTTKTATDTVTLSTPSAIP